MKQGQEVNMMLKPMLLNLLVATCLPDLTVDIQAAKINCSAHLIVGLSFTGAFLSVI